MAKDFLAFLGLVFLTILIIIGIGLIAYLFDLFQIIDLPSGLNAWINGQTKVYIDATPVDELDRDNQLYPRTAATPQSIQAITPAPSLTYTSNPPLEPAMYQVEITERLKRFVSALENWRDLNNELVKDSRLARDPNWLDEMKISLEVVVITGKGLAEVGPPPANYSTMDKWFDQIPTEAESLKNNYLNALKTGNNQSFLLAGDHFAVIKDALAGAVKEMIAQGWQVE